MHELSLTLSLMNLVAESAAANGLSRVAKVELRVGRWSGVCPESLSFAFQALVRGPLWTGAKLELSVVPDSAELLVIGYDAE